MVAPFPAQDGAFTMTLADALDRVIADVAQDGIVIGRS